MDRLAINSVSPPRRKALKVPPADGRSADAQFLRRVRAALVKHVGGKPSATQHFLIERAAWLSLYVDRLDRAALASGGAHGDGGSRRYLAYSNSLTRTLSALGLRSAAERPPSLAELMAAPSPRATA